MRETANQVLRLRCYSTDGALEVCSIDWDRRGIRVDRSIASSDFFELTPEAAVEFRAALDEAIKVVKDSGCRWSILCCDSNGRLEVCSIKTHRGTLRIGCGEADEPLWFFDLREKMIDQFRTAFDEALKGIEAYSVRRDKDTIATDTEELWSPDKEAPRFFALCAGIPPATIAVGLAFDNCVKIVSSLHDQGITFPSAEIARQSLSTYSNVQLIWPTR